MTTPLASTPPMGWNSWNTFGESINETVVRETADALLSTGLRECFEIPSRRRW
jgi:alpha-galactosidase